MESRAYARTNNGVAEILVCPLLEMNSPLGASDLFGRVLASEDILSFGNVSEISSGEGVLSTSWGWRSVGGVVCCIDLGVSCL